MSTTPGVHEGWEYNDKRTETVPTGQKNTNLTVLTRINFTLSPVSSTSVRITYSITDAPNDFENGDLVKETPIQIIELFGNEAMTFLDAVSNANETLNQLLRRCSDNKGREKDVIKTDQVNSVQPAGAWLTARDEQQKGER